MSVCGLTCGPSRISCCMVSARKSCSSHGLVSSFTKNRSSGIRMKLLSHVDWNYLTPLIHKHSTKRNHIIRSTIYASFGDMTDDSNAIVPRIHMKDPYKRLGISREASEEEIQAARNFLIIKSAGHEPSVDAIESAHDKIIMWSFLERKNPKINIKKKVRAVNLMWGHCKSV